MLFLLIYHLYFNLNRYILVSKISCFDIISAVRCLRHFRVFIEHIFYLNIFSVSNQLWLHQAKSSLYNIVSDTVNYSELLINRSL